MVGLQAWKRRKEHTIRYFLLFLMVLEVWTVCFAFEILTPTLVGKTFWSNMQFMGLTLLPIFWLETIMSYTGLGSGFRKQIPLALAFMGTTNLVIWTNDWHHWFRYKVYFAQSTTPFPIMVSQLGLWYYLYAAFSYFLFMISLAFLAHFYLSQQRFFRRQTLLLFTSVSIPLSVDLLFNLGITPIPYFNVTPMLFGISAFVVSAGLFPLHLFDLVPIAHNLMLETMTDGMIVLDNENRIVNINHAAREIIQVSTDIPVIGAPLNAVAANISEILTRFQKVEAGRIEIETQDEETRHFDINISLVQTQKDGVLGQVAIFRDVTERERLFEEVKRLATLDPLTGAYNRRYFFDTLFHEIARAHRYQHPLGLIMLDIDHFKMVNDTYGHVVGDAALKAIVQCCRVNLRAGDTVSRHGGEEFVLLLPETPLQETWEVAERLRKLIASQSFDLLKYEVFLTVSVGATSVFPNNTLTPDQLIEIVDNNLYQAKGRGRNCVVCSPGNLDTPNATSF